MVDPLPEGVFSGTGSSASPGPPLSVSRPLANGSSPCFHKALLDVTRPRSTSIFRLCLLVYASGGCQIGPTTSVYKGHEFDRAAAKHHLVSLRGQEAAKTFPRARRRFRAGYGTPMNIVIVESPA